MAKIIKKIVRVLLIITAVLIMVPLILLLLLQAPRIQTWAVNRVTGIITSKTGAEISVGRVSYSIWHEIVLDDILFRDLSGDTLLSARRVDLRIREIRPSRNLYSFGRIDVYEPDFRMVQDTSGVLNLTEYLESISGNKTPDTTRTIDIRFADIDLFDGSYTLADMSDTAGIIPGSVNFKNMHLKGIEGKVRDLRIIPDSVSMVIRGLSFTEGGGFVSRSTDLNLAVAGGSLYFREIDILTDSSAISAEKILLMPRDTSSWKDFVNEVRMDFLFNNSVLNTTDLSFFVRPLTGISEKVSLSGRVTGTVAEMKGRNIRISLPFRGRGRVEVGSIRCRFDYSPINKR
jgi:hypothetical protein